MLKVYSCIAYAHDLKLVALAAVICALASVTGINLLRHARKSIGQMLYEASRPGIELPEVPDSPASYATFEE